MDHIRRYVLFILVWFIFGVTIVPGETASAGSLNAQGVPVVEFTFVPHYGDYYYGILQGQVINISPIDYKIAVYIRLSGWWTKPTWANPTVPINADGSWSCDIVTGGNDHLATEIIAFAIPKSYSPPLLGGEPNLPDELYSNAAAYSQTTRSPSAPLLGLNYGPHREGQAPGGASPTPPQTAEDIALMAQKVPVIRIYSSQGINASIVAQARARGVQVVAQAWIDTNTANNQREINAAIALANANPNVIAVIVGSEVLMRNDVSEATLTGYIQQVQAAVSVPVGYADDDDRWLNHPNLPGVVDWVGLDLYGFWNCRPVTEAAQYTRDQWQAVRTNVAFAGKRILVLETGWPNGGYNAACPGTTPGSEQAQAQFTSAMLSLAEAEGMDLFLFEATDEPWKADVEPIVGHHWGLLDKNRKPWQAWNALSDLSPIHLVSPANDTTTTNAMPVLTWGKVLNAARYRVQIDNDPDFSSLAISADVSGTSYTVSTNLPNGQYYWRVQAHWGNWSDAWSFIVDYTPPLSAAPEREYYITATPTLCWNPVTWATEYQLQVDESPTFTSPLEYETTVSSGTLCALTLPLMEGRHYWRIRAKKGSTAGVWSAVETFIVHVP